ncbi:hypothetical protein EPO34_04150, partial [Patescibacteria group bacterium]
MAPHIHSPNFFEWARRVVGVLLVTGMIFGQIGVAHADVPRIISHQGRLLDSAGDLLGGSGGTDYCFRFSIFDDATVGAPDSQLWPAGTPSNMTAEVTQGVFNVNVGDTGAGGDLLDFNFEDDDDVYLNVQVATQVGGSCAGGDESFENLSPRQRITSAPYAINARTVGGFTPAQSADGDEIPVLTSGDLVLGDAAPNVTATGATALTIQGAGATGAVQFFSSANSLDSSGNFTIDGALTADGLTMNAAATFNADVDFTFAGTENVGLTSDLGGTVSMLSLTGTPSATAGTTRGIAIGQASSANTNGLDAALLIDNADADLAIGDAILITNTGGGGYTDLLDSPTLDISGAGAITGATGIAGSGTWDTSGALEGGTVNAVTSLSTAGTVRLDSSGNLTSIGNLTATGAITVSSTGATNDIILDSADLVIVQDDLTVNANLAFGAASPAIAIPNTDSLVVTDGTNTLLTVTDGGTVGNVSVTGTLGAGATTVSSLTVGTILLSAVGTSNSTSGASLVGVFDEFTNSSATTVQDVLDDLDAAIGAGGSKWTDDGTFTYLSSATDDLVLGGSTVAGASFFFDESA